MSSIHLFSAVENPAVAQNANGLKVVMALVMGGCSVTFVTGKKHSLPYKGALVRGIVSKKDVKTGIFL